MYVYTVHRVFELHLASVLHFVNDFVNVIEFWHLQYAPTERNFGALAAFCGDCRIRARVVPPKVFFCRLVVPKRLVDAQWIAFRTRRRHRNRCFNFESRV